MDGEAARALATFQELLANNPHTGTAEQVVNLSLGIAEASQTLSAATFALYRDESGVGEKVFSKLKVIGERLGQLDARTRGEVLKGLPASYSTIHLLCALKSEELVTATVKRKHITPKTSVRAATAYVKQVRFPQQVVTEIDEERKRYFVSDETLYQICRSEHIELDHDQHLLLGLELKAVCKRYGLELRRPINEKTTALREADRRERAAFWRQVLENELTQKWFEQSSSEVRKQFNIKVLEEIWDAPLRTFTGFLVRTCGGRDKFYEVHGQAYVAKLHYLQEFTEDRSSRFNFKRRIEEVLTHKKGTHLAKWRNIVLKNSGLQ
jgi:hypothetical protein